MADFDYETATMVTRAEVVRRSVANSVPLRCSDTSCWVRLMDFESVCFKERP